MIGKRIMWSLEQKQKYLRDHIPQEQHEQFWGYIQQAGGNYDIETWTNQFIIDLVNQFKHNKAQQNNGHQTSFFQYQADSKAQAPIINNHFAWSSLSNSFQPTNHETKPAYKEEKGQSPFILLDQMLHKPNNKPTSAHQPQAVKTPPSVEKNDKTPPSVEKSEPHHPSLYATNQFWEMGSAASAGKGQKVKSAADFTTFDFWSQPSSANSSPQSFKSVNFDNFNHFVEKVPHRKEEKLERDDKKTPIPSFDELIVKYQTEKGPSPYNKKANHEEVVVKKQPEKPNVVSEKQGDKPIQKVVQKPIERPIVKHSTKVGKVIYDGEIVLKQQFQDTLKCFPSTQRVGLKDGNLRVTIDGHEIIQRTFLMSDYVMYSVRVHPLDIICKRNYEDFSRLKNTLTKLFPGTKLAYLDKNSWFWSTSLEFIKEQKVMLEFFLNDLIQNPQIRNSRILEDFLTQPEHKKIKRKFEQWEKLQEPQAIQQLCWLGGIVEVNLSQQQRLYQQNFKRYHVRMLDFLEKQKRLTNTLTEQYKEIDTTQNALIKLVKGMIDDTKYFNERVYGLQLTRIQEALKVIHSSYCEENEIIKFNIELNTSMTLPFIKYEKENITELQELIETQQTFFKSYLKRSAMQKIEQGMPYTSDKVKSFKTGVLIESRNILVLKYQTAFLSNQICVEGHRMIQTLGQKYLSLLNNYSDRCQQQCMKSLEFWSSSTLLCNNKIA